MARKKPQLSKPSKVKSVPREKFVASGSDKEKFTVLIDSAEQTPRQFIKSTACNGSTTANLLWGDYSIEGLEDKFTIERKGSPQEFYHNLCTDDWTRFEKELIALQEYPDAYIVCEFSINDVIKFPSSCKLPLSIKRKIGNRGPYYLRRVLEIMSTYNIPIIFANTEENARTIMISLFKRIWAKYSQ